MSLRWAAFATCLCAGVAIEQVHTALGLRHDTLTVSWVTPQQVARPFVVYGDSPSSLTLTAKGDSREFGIDPNRTWYTHVASMTGLRTNTTYYYQVRDEHNATSVYKIMHRRIRAANDPYRHIILGDMGASCAFSLCPACSQKSQYCNATTCAHNTTAGMVSEVETADMFLHLGDFAYDLSSDGGKTGDVFMRNIEQLAARNVYMVSHGNHEDSRPNLAHYIERFRNMPSNAVPQYFDTANGRALNTLYFSWDHGLVHYVSISTELFFGVHDKHTTHETLIRWLKADLEKANANRHNVPWVMVQGHRSVYCTCDGDCHWPAWELRWHIERILHEYGVDLFVNGHEHNYERTFPVYESRSDRSNINPRATIYVVSGAAGSHEMHEPFTLRQPKWSAFRSNSFSYSRVLVHNATHLHWQQVQTDPVLFPTSDYGRVIDDWWIVQDRHGPFSLDEAPKQNASGPCDDDLCTSHDHWEPLLGLPRAAGDKHFSDAIARYRAQHGEGAWLARLRRLMHDTRRRGVAAEWEDVHEDGNSDSAWRADSDFKWRGGSA